jgi:alkanesulfonate monooxygenase SsuD/methylene tetrahydromethanopterin reductase-like flavin-dependent oxidoreductase (luciferase family)
MLAALSAVTSRVELGPLVAATTFHNPAVIAKKAATIDEISGGRLILGLGAGWSQDEHDAYGLASDHRVARFDEAFTIIRCLLRDGRVDFDGRFYRARDCELVPRGPRPNGPPLMVGTVGPKLLRIGAAHMDSWNGWYDRFGNTPDGFAALSATVDAAAREVARDPAAIERTAAVLVRLPGGVGRVQGERVREEAPAIHGTAEELAAGLAAFARVGASHLQLVLDPITVDSITALAPVLELLDGG